MITILYAFNKIFLLVSSHVLPNELKVLSLAQKSKSKIVPEQGFRSGTG